MIRFKILIMFVRNFKLSSTFNRDTLVTYLNLGINQQPILQTSVSSVMNNDDEDSTEYSKFHHRNLF